MQLLVISALLLASKFEEKEPPLLCDLVHVTDHSCTRIEVLAMERKILHTVDWFLGLPSPLHFLNRNCQAAKVSARHAWGQGRDSAALSSEMYTTT